MYLIFLVEPNGQERAYSTIDAQPTTDMLKEKLTEIAKEHNCAVVARSHYPNALPREVYAYPNETPTQRIDGDPNKEPTALDKILSGEPNE